MCASSEASVHKSSSLCAGRQRKETLALLERERLRSRAGFLLLVSVGEQ